MVIIPEQLGKIFASEIMEDIFSYAETHQDEYIAFITSNGDKKKLADTYKNEPTYKQRAVI
jgi:hypothetical protein